MKNVPGEFEFQVGGKSYRAIHLGERITPAEMLVFARRHQEYLDWEADSVELSLQVVKLPPDCPRWGLRLLFREAITSDVDEEGEHGICFLKIEDLGDGDVWFVSDVQDFAAVSFGGDRRPDYFIVRVAE